MFKAEKNILFQVSVQSFKIYKCLSDVIKPDCLDGLFFLMRWGVGLTGEI